VTSSFQIQDHFIEAAADELDEIFHTAADISFKQMKTKKRNKVSQKWFDLDLNIMKKKVDEKAKHMSRYPNDPYIRGSFPFLIINTVFWSII
jgi:hypothetical protein